MFDLLFSAVTAPAVIVDLVVIAIILVMAIVSSAKGFMKCLIGFIGTVMSIVLALLFCKAVSSFFQNQFGWLSSLSDFFCERFSSLSAFNVPIEDAKDLTNLNVPAFIVSVVIEAFSSSPIPEGTTAAQLIAPVLAQYLLNIISFVIIFLLIKLVCFFLNKTLGEAFRTIPIIRSVNGILGFVVGVIEAVFLICTLLYVLSFIPADGVGEFIASTVIVQFFYENNIAGIIFKLTVSSGWVFDFVTNCASAVAALI